jgi:hypothetical protein
VAAAHFGCCVCCVLCVVVVTSFTLVGREAKIRPAKMANFFALTTEKAPQNAPKFKGCPKSQSSIDLGHPLTLWLLPIREELEMRIKCVIFT